LPTHSSSCGSGRDGGCLHVAAAAGGSGGGRHLATRNELPSFLGPDSYALLFLFFITW